MKLRMSRVTVHGTVTIEEEVPTQGIVDVTRRVRAALDQAVAEMVPRATMPDPSAHYAPVVEPDRTTAPAEHYPPCEPPPSNGRELWKWAYHVGACKRVLELGAAHHLPAKTRADVYRWFPDSVKGVYHDIIVKPASAPGRPGRKSREA